jgi:hypothetical protein
MTVQKLITRSLDNFVTPRLIVSTFHLHVASLASVGLCIGLWIRAKTVDQEERGNAERRALFVGLWPPMLWLIGDSLQEHES